MSHKQGKLIFKWKQQLNKAVAQRKEKRKIDNMSALQAEIWHFAKTGNCPCEKFQLIPSSTHAILNFISVKTWQI